MTPVPQASVSQVPVSLATDTVQRLVDQVQALSSVAETLTLRLLDLEERLQVQERAVAAARTPDLGELAERRLADTEQRLQGLEQMLASTASEVAVLAVADAVPQPAPDDEEGWDQDDDWIEQDAISA